MWRFFQQQPENIEQELSLWRGLWDIVRWFSLGALTALIAYFSSIAWLGPTIKLPSEGTTPYFYVQPGTQDLALTLEKAIATAKKRLYCEIYTLSDNRMLTQLRQLSKKGVQVTILTDKNHAHRLQRILGANIAVFPSQGQGLMHRKIVVIDDTHIWLGSANLTWESLRAYPNFLVGLVSDAMAHDLQSKQTVYKEYTVAGQPLTMGLLPQWKEGLATLRAAIDGAKKSIKIAMFSWTRQDLAEAVIAAHQRGVAVEVILDHDNAQLGHNHKIRRLLQEKGIPVYLYKKQHLMHHKMVWIDEKTLITGSANWTQAAWGKNYEIVLTLPKISFYQNKLLQNMWGMLRHASA